MLIRLRRSTRAFSLLELVVVIVILAVLASLAIPTFGRVVVKSKDQVSLVGLQASAREATAIGVFTGGKPAALAAGLLASGDAQASGGGLTASGGTSRLVSVAHDTDYDGVVSTGTAEVADLGQPSKLYGFFSSAVAADGTLSLAMTSLHAPHCVFSVYKDGSLLGSSIDEDLGGQDGCVASAAASEVANGPVTTPPTTAPPTSPTVPVTPPSDVTPVTCPDDCGYVVPDNPVTRAGADPVVADPCATTKCGQASTPTAGADLAPNRASDFNYLASFAYTAGDTADAVYVSLETTGALARVTDDFDDDGLADVRLVAEGIPGASGVLIGNNPTKSYAGFHWVADSVYVASSAGTVYRVDARTGAKSVVASGFSGTPTHLTGWACPSGTLAPVGASYPTCLYVGTTTGVDLVVLGADGTGTPERFVTGVPTQGLRLMNVAGKLRLWVNTDDAGATSYTVNRAVASTITPSPGGEALGGPEHRTGRVIAGGTGALYSHASDGSGPWSTEVADASIGKVSDVHDHGRPGRYYFVDRSHNKVMAVSAGRAVPVAGSTAGYASFDATWQGGDVCAVSTTGTLDCYRGTAAITEDGSEPFGADTDYFALSAARKATAPLSGVTSVDVSGDYGFASACATAGREVSCWSDESFSDLETFSFPVPVSSVAVNDYTGGFMAVSASTGRVFMVGVETDQTSGRSVQEYTLPSGKRATAGAFTRFDNVMQPLVLFSDGTAADLSSGVVQVNQGNVDPDTAPAPLTGITDLGTWQMGTLLRTSDGSLWAQSMYDNTVDHFRVSTDVTSFATGGPRPLGANNVGIFATVRPDGSVEHSSARGQSTGPVRVPGGFSQVMVLKDASNPCDFDRVDLITLSQAGELRFLHTSVLSTCG